MSDEVRFSDGDTILPPDAVRYIKFVALPPRDETSFIPRPYVGPPEWWFRFRLHYVLMVAIGAAWLGCLFLAIFFLSGGIR